MSKTKSAAAKKSAPAATAVVTSTAVVLAEPVAAPPRATTSAKRPRAVSIWMSPEEKAAEMEKLCEPLRKKLRGPVPEVCRMEDRRTGMFSICTAELTMSAGPAILQSLCPTLDTEKWPEYFNVFLSEEEDGTGNIIFNDDALPDTMDMDHSDCRYGLVLLMVRNLGVLLENPQLCE